MSTKSSVVSSIPNNNLLSPKMRRLNSPKVVPASAQSSSIDKHPIQQIQLDLEAEIIGLKVKLMDSKREARAAKKEK